MSEVLFNSGGSEFYLYNENSDRTTGVNVLQVADQVIFSVASSSRKWVLVVEQYDLPTGKRSLMFHYNVTPYAITDTRSVLKSYCTSVLSTAWPAGQNWPFGVFCLALLIKNFCNGYWPFND